MKHQEILQTALLNAQTIDRFSETVQRFLSEIGIDSKEQQRLRLSLEEVLLQWNGHFGENAEGTLRCVVRLGQPVITLTLPGASFDPLTTADDAFSAYTGKLLANLETTPVYSYTGNHNCVTWKLLRPKHSTLKTLALSLVCALILGLLGLLLPESLRQTLSQNWITPLRNTYQNVLGLCGIPLIFVSVVLGISGVGDIASFGKIGKKMVGHFFLSLALSTTIAALIALPCFSYSFGASGSAIVYKDFWEMLLGFLPTSFLTPFLDCNAMQLILLGALVGIGILKLESKAKHFADVIDSFNNFLLLVAGWLTKLIPIFSSIIIIDAIWTGDLPEMLHIWRPLVITLALELLSLFVPIFLIHIRHRIPISRLVKKISETFLIAFGTGSCCASIPENYACCADKLGIDSKVYVFGIPIGTTIFKPGFAIRFVVLAFFMAELFQVSISVEWVVLAILLAMIFSIAIPAIPGGAMLFFAMFFTQLGIPAEAIPLAVATDIFFDNFSTACAQVAVQLDLTLQSDRLDLLNEKILSK